MMYLANPLPRLNGNKPVTDDLLKAADSILDGSAAFLCVSF